MPYLSREKLAERPKKLNAEELITEYFPNSTVNNILEIANDGHFGVYLKNKKDDKKNRMGFVRLILGYTTPTFLYNQNIFFNLSITYLYTILLIEVIKNNLIEKINRASGLMRLEKKDIEWLIDNEEIIIRPDSFLSFDTTQVENLFGISLNLNTNKVLHRNNPDSSETQRIKPYKITKDDLFFVEDEVIHYESKHPEIFNNKKTEASEQYEKDSELGRNRENATKWGKIRGKEISAEKDKRYKPHKKIAMEILVEQTSYSITISHLADLTLNYIDRQKNNFEVKPYVKSSLRRNLGKDEEIQQKLSEYKLIPLNK